MNHYKQLLDAIRGMGVAEENLRRVLVATLIHSDFFHTWQGKCHKDVTDE